MFIKKYGLYLKVKVKRAYNDKFFLECLIFTSYKGISWSLGLNLLKEHNNYLINLMIIVALFVGCPKH